MTFFKKLYANIRGLINFENQPKASLKDNEIDFKQNLKLKAIAKEFAEDSVLYAQESFNLTLDFSEKSIEILEEMVDFLSRSKQEADQQQINEMGYMLGSYLGEVYIKHHGGKWGNITLDEQQYPGIQGKNEVLFWPWVRVIQRINDGKENNLWHYYQVIIKD